MTSAEAKKAFLDGVPVRYSFGRNEIDYVKISALVYRKEENKVILQLELLDKSLHAVFVALPKYVNVIQTKGREENE